MSTETWIALSSGLGVGTILAAVVAAWAARKRVKAEAAKLGADAVQIFQSASAGLVADYRKQVVEERADHERERAELVGRLDAQSAAHAEERAQLNAKVDRLVNGWRQERESARRVLQAHVAFDMLAIAKLADAGIDLGMDPPPLLPPIRANLDEV